MVRLFLAQGPTAFKSAIIGRNARRDLAQGNTRTIEARWGLQIADYYASLVKKYRLAIAAPWISVEYEPPFFYPAGPPPSEISSDRPTSGNPPERAAEDLIHPGG